MKNGTGNYEKIQNYCTRKKEENNKKVEKEKKEFSDLLKMFGDYPDNIIFSLEKDEDEDFVISATYIEPSSTISFWEKLFGKIYHTEEKIFTIYRYPENNGLEHPNDRKNRKIMFHIIFHGRIVFEASKEFNKKEDVIDYIAETLTTKKIEKRFQFNW